jgi:hypothetical protein
MILATPSFPSGAKLRTFGLVLRRRVETDPYRYYEAHSGRASTITRQSAPWYRLGAQEMLAVDVCAAAQWMIHARGTDVR